MSFTHPNFPNYRMGTGFPTCDESLDIPTGIRELFSPESASPLGVFPNPTTGEVNLQLPVLLALSDQVQLEVRDLLGNVVIQTPQQAAFELFNGATAQLDLSNHPAGMYLVRLSSTAGENWMARVLLLEN